METLEADIIKENEHENFSKPSSQIDKHLGSQCCTMLRTILKMYKGITQRNDPEDNKIDDDTNGSTFER